MLQCTEYINVFRIYKPMHIIIISKKQSSYIHFQGETKKNVIIRNMESISAVRCDRHTDRQMGNTPT